MKPFVSVTALLVLVAAHPVPGRAQTRWNVELGGGAALPTGDLSRAQDPGGSLALGIGLWLKPKVGIRLDAGWDFFSGASVRGRELPGMTFGRYGLGVEVHLLEPGLVPWTALVNVGAGISTVDFTRRDPQAGALDVDARYFALDGGVALGYDVAVGVNLFLKGRIHVVFGNERELRFEPGPTGEADASDLPSMATTVSFPLVLGVRFDFFSP